MRIWIRNTAFFLENLRICGLDRLIIANLRICDLRFADKKKNLRSHL
jgi:hypothetical protein